MARGHALHRLRSRSWHPAAPPRHTFPKSIPSSSRTVLAVRRLLFLLLQQRVSRRLRMLTALCGSLGTSRPPMDSNTLSPDRRRNRAPASCIVCCTTCCIAVATAFCLPAVCPPHPHEGKFFMNHFISVRCWHSFTVRGCASVQQIANRTAKCGSQGPLRWRVGETKALRLTQQEIEGKDMNSHYMEDV